MSWPLDDDSILYRPPSRPTVGRPAGAPWREGWLLEQGSNLQALRRLINSQVRLPIPPSRKSVVGVPVAAFALPPSRPRWLAEPKRPQGAKAGGMSGTRTRRRPLARRRLSLLSYHPVWLRNWSSELVSSQPLRGFGAALSPDQLSERIPRPSSLFELRRAPASAKALPAEALAKAGGADGRNRTYATSVAPKPSATELHPRNLSSPSSLFELRRAPVSAKALPAEASAKAGGGGLRVRTSVLAGPLGFRDRLPATPAEPSVASVRHRRRATKDRVQTRQDDGRRGRIRTCGLLLPKQAL